MLFTGDNWAISSFTGRPYNKANWSATGGINRPADNATVGAIIGGNLRLPTQIVPTQAEIVTLEGTANTITGRGSLALQNSVNYETQVTDTGTYGRYQISERNKLTGVATGATVGAVIGSNLRRSSDSYLYNQMKFWEFMKFLHLKKCLKTRQNTLNTKGSKVRQYRNLPELMNATRHVKNYMSALVGRQKAPFEELYGGDVFEIETYTELAVLTNGTLSASEFENIIHYDEWVIGHTPTSDAGGAIYFIPPELARKCPV